MTILLPGPFPMSSAFDCDQQPNNTLETSETTVFNRPRMDTKLGNASRLIIFTTLAVILASTFAMAFQYETVKKSGHSSGIKGTIMLTGNCPGPQRKDDNSCGPRPYEGPLAVKRNSDQEVVATGKSDHEGKFSIAVRPGKYIITQAGESRYPMIHSDEIVVTRHKFVTVKLTADLGMR